MSAECNHSSSGASLPPLAELAGFSGDDTLFPAVYAELRRMAAGKMLMERDGHTLQPTALVHEAWLRLGDDFQGRWKNRSHFLAAAAEAMRRILIERARQRNQIKRGGGWERVHWEALESVNLAETTQDGTLLRINEILDSMETAYPQQAQLIKLRFFAGLNISEAATALSISPATAKRHWAFARAWILAELKAGA